MVRSRKSPRMKNRTVKTDLRSTTVYTSNEQSDNEIKKTLPFTITAKRIKHVK